MCNSFQDPFLLKPPYPPPGRRFIPLPCSLPPFFLAMQSFPQFPLSFNLPYPLLSSSFLYALFLQRLFSFPKGSPLGVLLSPCKVEHQVFFFFILKVVFYPPPPFPSELEIFLGPSREPPPTRIFSSVHATQLSSQTFPFPHNNENHSPPTSS